MKKTKKMKMTTRSLVTAAAVTVTALAGATARAEAPGPEIRELREVRKIVGPGGDRLIHFRGAEAPAGKAVKDAPYTATAVTEIEQTLGDGNKIRQRTSAAVARDREGRTRREVQLGAVGPLVSGADGHRMIFIDDPVAGASFHVDPARKVTHRLPRAPLLPAPLPPPGDDVLIAGPAPGPAPFFAGAVVKDLPKPVEESLGTKTVEGLRAEGVRTTTTIAAGKIGNERPISIVSERWSAPELGGTVVWSRHSDPRLGTTTYRLTEIARREPERALFTPPSDHRIEERPVGPHKVIIKREGNGAAPPVR